MLQGYQAIPEGPPLYDYLRGDKVLEGEFDGLMDELTATLAPDKELHGREPLDLEEFMSRFMAHYAYKKRCEMHDEIINLAQDETEENILIVAPRGFGKSVLCSVIIPLWRLCEGLSRFILIVSDSSSQAEGFLRDIITELEENEALKEWYGTSILPKKDRKKQVVKWTDSDIITADNRRIAARGCQKKLRGIRTRQWRPDYLIVDDLENDEYVKTPEQRKKTKNWFNEALLNCLDPENARTFIIGTIIHYDSLLKNLQKNEAYTSRFYRAIKGDGTALWADLWDLEKLAKLKKKIGTHAFNKEKMNNPLNPEDKPFKEFWLRYYTHADIAGKNLKIYQAIDLAIKKKTKNDYFVIITIGVDDDKNVYILDIFRKKLDFPAQVKAVQKMYKKWKPKRVAIEENGYQEALKQQVLTQDRIPFKPITNIADKYTRIITIAPDFENGKIFISENFLDFIEEYSFYPEGAHDDMLDALEMALRFVGSSGDSETYAGKLDKMPDTFDLVDEDIDMNEFLNCEYEYY